LVEHRLTLPGLEPQLLLDASVVAAVLHRGDLAEHGDALLNKVRLLLPVRDVLGSQLEQRLRVRPIRRGHDGYLIGCHAYPPNVAKAINETQ
jgi:hypothetical protein